MLKRLYEHYQRFYHFWKWQKKKELNLNLLLADVWPPDPFITIDHNQRLLQGPGFEVSLKDLWTRNDFSPLQEEYLHSFHWLSALRHYGDTQSRLIGRDCIIQWYEQSKKFSSLVWNIDVLGKRLASWLKLYEFFAASANDTFCKNLNHSIFQQSRYLESCFILEDSPIKRLFSLKGLILSQMAIQEFEKKLRFSLQWLANELKMQILDDGMHYSRQPTLQIALLQDLLDIRSALKTDKQDSPLQYYIEKMVPVVRLLRHGDGGVAYFNQGHYCKPELLDRVLSYADTQGKPAPRALISGFERLQSEKTLILANMGQEFVLNTKDNATPPPSGPLYNLELSIGKQRIITTLPSGRFSGTNNNSPEQNTTAILSGLGHAHGYTPIERLEQEGNKLISGKRFWNFPDFSYSHTRQIFLNASGMDIRGQDTFCLHSHLKVFSSQQPFEIFFHLHPAIQIHDTTLSSIILLKIPTLGQWYFHYSHNVHIECQENFHYLEKPYKGCTLILKGVISYPKEVQETTSQTIKWAFKSE